MQKINIAIDGYSSCGKSTLARQLAEKLNYIYIDSGAMYRAITLHALQSGWLHDDGFEREKLIAALPQIDVRFARTPEQDKAVIHLNGKPVEHLIREMRVSARVSEVAAVPEVRAKLVELQSDMAREKGVVMDGRDIGTNVLPDAHLKLFMTADPMVRAERRYSELKEKGMQVSLDEVHRNLLQRDEEDSNRAVNPLRQAEDAVVIDNTNLTLEGQFQKALDLVEATIRAA